MVETRGERAVRLAGRLLRLGISHKGVTELLMFPLEDLENQLDWLPLRKAKRPGAYLIEAVRRNYQPPKELFYAKDQIEAARIADTVDPDSEPRH